MAGASESLHEARDALEAETLDRHRALVSIQEELEAVDWYQQRIDAAGDPDLAAILAHNRDDEKEHLAMVLEWLRRRDPALDEELRRHLWHHGGVTEEPDDGSGDTGAGDGAAAAAPSLGIGSLKGVRQG